MTVPQVFSEFDLSVVSSAVWGNTTSVFEVGERVGVPRSNGGIGIGIILEAVTDNIPCVALGDGTCEHKHRGFKVQVR